MHESAEKIIRTFGERSLLTAFVVRLNEWLADEANHGDEPALVFSNSRAKAALRTSDVIDEASLQDFSQLLENAEAERVALYDLLSDTSLAGEDEVATLATMSGTNGDQSILWISLILSSYSWRSGYSLQHLDPASPPGSYSPAGQVLKRSAQFIRRQVQRSATERDKLARRLSLPPMDVPSLDDLESSGESTAPMPPHYRPPVPERYPEMVEETLQIDQDDVEQAPSITLGDPLIITEDELNNRQNESSEPLRMEPITISPDQVAPEITAPPSPIPSSGVVMPSPSPGAGSRPSFTVALRQMLGHEELTTTKLRVLVQRYPDGPGLYGLQVRVTCKGVKSYVAGTTDRDGKFICELPVRIESGLTYDVDVTWPREEGSEVERKSITLNSDRTQFSLPFYRFLEAPGNGS